MTAPVTTPSPDQLVTRGATAVTRASAAERKRRQRERDRQAAELVYEQEDWQLFLDYNTLCQKAGCYPDDLRKIAIKELCDNALDAATDPKNVSISVDQEGVCTVFNDGVGLDPDKVPDFFRVNRPLRSTKQKRLPVRGALGNGLRVVMGAVVVYEGWITVETRGHLLKLGVDPATGKTIVTAHERVEQSPGVRVRIWLPPHISKADITPACNSCVCNFG